MVFFSLCSENFKGLFSFFLFLKSSELSGFWLVYFSAYVSVGPIGLFVCWLISALENCILHGSYFVLFYIVFCVPPLFPLQL